MIDNLFLCVGAQKAGTTWLFAQLDGHKDICFSDVKEVHYFNTIHNGSILLTRRKVEHLERLIKNNKYALEKYFTDLSAGHKVDTGIKRLLDPVNDEWYINLFANKKGRYAADFSPEYALIGNNGFLNVKSVSQNQKIIYMMRDPVSRAKSAIKYYYKMKGRNIADVPSGELLKLSGSDLITNMSRYDITVKSLRENFSKGQVLYMFYEDVMLDKQKAISEVCHFLDIENIIIPEEQLNKKVNITEDFDIDAPICRLLEKNLVATYEFMKDNFNIPETWSDVK